MEHRQEDVVLVSRRGSTATVTMNRPGVLNVLDDAMADGLVAAFATLAADDTVRVVILTGAGRSFMAGGDLARFHADLEGAPGTAAGLIDKFHRLMRIMKDMRALVIAAVHGPVAGGGVGLAFACDLVVAAEGTTFLSAYTKIGTSPDGGTTWSLTRLMGPRRALEFVLFNQPLPADKALEWGMVNRVVPKDDLTAAVEGFADRLVASATGATASVKRLIQSATQASFDEQLEREKASFVAAAGTADFREGISAFFEKRQPFFS